MKTKTLLHKSELAKAPLILVPQYFGSTVFVRRTSKYLPFDVETTALLKRLKRVPFDTILSEVEEDERRNQLWRFFEHFYELGFFTIENKFAGTILDVEIPEKHLVGPLAVHLEVVAACTLKCKHCFADILPRKEKRLTFAELDRLFATLARMGTFRVGLTGGEPLLRRDIFDIIDLATSYGLHACITTNGLLITEEIAREFGKRELIWLNVSLDGATAQTNDLIRGTGTFDAVIERLKILSKHTPFTLAFTIMRQNLAQIQACAELAYEVGAQTAVFRPLYPVGIARHNLELMPTFAEYNHALNLLANLEEQNKLELCSLDPFSAQTRQESQSFIHQNYGCGAGNSVCSISVSGEMNPCSFLGPAFVAGNIRDSSFEELWHNSQGFRTIRALPGGTEETFNGGCRARSLVFKDSINAPDPWVTAKEISEPNHLLKPSSAKTLYHPMSILELSAMPTKSLGG